MITQTFDLTDREFEMFKELIHRISGIYLSEQKKKLVVARLSRRLRALNLDTFTQYYHYLTENPAGASEIENLINRVTTNKTDFFREVHHFDFLKDEVLPAIISKGEATGNRRVRVWSAGCSTGEEPYSIAIICAVAIMMFAARPISDFVDTHPTIKILALSFLLLVGVTLIVEGERDEVNRCMD
ncbi:MAG TPA: CheR family methyltransferase, partial [Deltaproteobacteria bacterium]|nr:CheR family methyltransferase [Deltaproteobacteria bacterium]